MFILLTGCDRCCTGDPQTILQCVPYQYGDQLRFKTSQGDTLLYAVSRVLEERISDNMGHCDNEYLNYQDDESRLTPADSGLVMELKMPGHSCNYPFYEIRIADNKFLIYTKTHIYIYPEVLDSFMIDGKTYYDVFNKVPNRKDSLRSNYIPLDSLHYNYAYGILAIYFSDSSNYVVVE